MIYNNESVSRVLAYYEEAGKPNMFVQDLLSYVRQGYVRSTNRYFIMAKPVIDDDDEKCIRGNYFYDPTSCNAWYVKWFAGDEHGIYDALESFPIRYPKIGWIRAVRGGPGKLSFYSYSRMKSLIINQIASNMVAY